MISVRRILSAGIKARISAGAAPFNMTYSVTGKCNSKCKTCNIWKKEAEDLTLLHWKQMLESIGSPAWVTISGGEPFLRKDFAELMQLVASNRPEITTIATNGILTGKIIRDITKIRKIFSGSLIVNISVDGAAEMHDLMRGVQCHRNVKKTIEALKKIGGVHVGVHTVFSRFNIDDADEIIEYVRSLAPHSYICQAAENRVELHNVGESILPEIGKYLAANRKIQNLKLDSVGVSRLTRHMRKRYYRISNRLLTDNEKSIDCYAGIASAHVNYNGDLWACCVRGEKMGNLIDQGFDEIWNSDRATAIRKRIKDEGCFCTMANACYSNIVCQPFS